MPGGYGTCPYRGQRLTWTSSPGSLFCKLPLLPEDGQSCTPFPNTPSEQKGREPPSYPGRRRQVQGIWGGQCYTRACLLQLPRLDLQWSPCPPRLHAQPHSLWESHQLPQLLPIMPLCSAAYQTFKMLPSKTKTKTKQIRYLFWGFQQTGLYSLGPRQGSLVPRSKEGFWQNELDCLLARPIMADGADGPYLVRGLQLSIENVLSY